MTITVTGNVFPFKRLVGLSFLLKIENMVLHCMNLKIEICFTTASCSKATKRVTLDIYGAQYVMALQWQILSSGQHPFQIFKAK